MESTSTLLRDDKENFNKCTEKKNGVQGKGRGPV